MKATIAKWVSLAILSGAGAHALPAQQQQYSTEDGGSFVTFGIGADLDRVTALTHMLSLNASQQAQAKAIFDEEDAATKPLFEQLKQASDELVSAQKSAAPDAEIDQLARNMSAISGEILAIDAKAQSKVYRQLSAEQKKKLEQFPHPPFLGISAPLLIPGPGAVFMSTSSRQGAN
jgi:Spy/CpxP family protein refolding chaperone